MPLRIVDQNLRQATEVTYGRMLTDYRLHRSRMPKPTFALTWLDISHYYDKSRIANTPVVASQIVDRTTMVNGPRYPHSWENTVYQYIYDTLGDYDLSRWFLGLLVKEVAIKRRDEWRSCGWEQPGREYETRIYWPVV